MGGIPGGDPLTWTRPRAPCALLVAATVLASGGGCRRAPPPAPAPAPAKAPAARPPEPPRCDSAASCLALGDQELRAPSHEGAVEAAFGKACQLGSAEACFRLSHYLVLRGVDRERINGLLDRGCELGHLESCGIVGDALIEGSRGRTKDVARGMALFERACDKGEARACVRLADIHAAGEHGIARNRKKEALYLKRARALGWKEP